ncbi:MAG: histidine phosphatase family protein [Acidimicrobiales bacterium]|nr:histidine phosphatase family protein [Acidimicrobiales bacterium]
MVTTVVLVRHGQSTWNAEFRWQGQADPPLSDLGRRQAITAASTLPKSFSWFDHAVTSPQTRAWETADLLLTEAGLDLKAERVPNLRERNAGEWSGLTKEEIESQYPGFLQSGRRPPGYEADDDLFRRVSSVLFELHQSAARGSAPTADRSLRSDSTVLAICHGGVINSLVDQLAPERRSRVPNLSGWTARVDGRSITMGERFDLLSPNERTGGDAVRI